MVFSLAGAAANVATQVTGGLIKTSGTNQRLDQNSTNYQLAQQGNQDAVNQLAARAGWGPNGAIDTGDAQTKVDAQNKIQALVGAGIIKGSPWPPPPGFPRILFLVVNKATAADGKTADGGNTGTSLQSVTTSNPPWALVLGAVVAAYLVFRFMKRG